MARVDAESVARAVARLAQAYDADPDGLAPLAVLLDPGPGEGYDPDERPEDRG